MRRVRHKSRGMSIKKRLCRLFHVPGASDDRVYELVRDLINSKGLPQDPDAMRCARCTRMLPAKYYSGVPGYGDLCIDCHNWWLNNGGQRVEVSKIELGMTAGEPVLRFVGRVLCRHEPCQNNARYSSGYCGLCDIRFNAGNGTKGPEHG